MPKRFLIYQHIDPETGEIGREYYTQNPIPEGTKFEVQYGSQTLWFRMCMHYLTDETVSVVELVGVGEPCVVKRPRLPRRQD